LVTKRAPAGGSGRQKTITLDAPIEMKTFIETGKLPSDAATAQRS
jgi:hypothetical protein